MRSVQALRQGRLIAEQRAAFYRTIKKWSTEDLNASVFRYRMQARALPRAERFYMVRVRVIAHEIRVREAKREIVRLVRS
jgi:hypothetical protein